jgi:hypothetical protein
VLYDSTVFLRGADELTSFPKVVGTGFLDVDILAGLASPNGHQRMPVIGRCDGYRIDRSILQQLANVYIGFWLAAEFPETLSQEIFVYVAQGRNFDVRYP